MCLGFMFYKVTKICCVCNRVVLFNNNMIATNPIDPNQSRKFYHKDCYYKLKYNIKGN